MRIPDLLYCTKLLLILCNLDRLSSASLTPERLSSESSLAGNQQALDAFAGLRAHRGSDPR